MRFIKRLEELLDASPKICQRTEAEVKKRGWTVPEILQSLRRTRSLDGSLGSLQALQKKKSAMGYWSNEDCLAHLLSYFPPEAISEQFGQDTFLWLLAYKEKIFFTGLWNDEDVQKLTGKNKRTMVRACTTAAEFTTVTPPTLYRRETIFAIADCIDSLQETLISIDLEALLRGNVKEGRTFPRQRSSEYHIQPLHAKENCRGYVKIWDNRIIEKTHQKISVYLDVPMALSLFWNDAPAAVAGILPVSPKTLVIYQLQGVKPLLIDEQKKEIGKGGSWGLEPLDWKKLLVESVLHLAGKLGFTEVGIQSGYDNVWRKCGGLPLERALAIYDGTAQRLGFKQRSFLRRNKDQTWYRNITNYG
ncbi:MAG: hypothetical protein Q8R53_04480 [Nanoarchaeota archaeon]|nr:hypothetical protein [Nanoarchaeota archaeon]